MAKMTLKQIYAMRARQAAVGPLRYRYDAKSGTVRKIGQRAFKALQAKTARGSGSMASARRTRSHIRVNGRGTDPPRCRRR